MRQSDRVYSALRNEITNWRLQPGSPLSEVEIASRLGVSRTPVRTALQGLLHDGLAESNGRGLTVATVSLRTVSHLFQMREALETYLARLCARKGNAQRFEALQAELESMRDDLEGEGGEPPVSAYYDLTRRFDAAILSEAANPYLAQAAADLQIQLERLRRLAKRNPTRMMRATHEHLSICMAICARDESLAASATAVHIQSSLQNILRELVQDSTSGKAGGGLATLSVGPALTPDEEV